MLLLVVVCGGLSLHAQGAPIKRLFGMGRSSNVNTPQAGVCTITDPTEWPNVAEGQTAPTVTITTANCTAPVTCTVTSGALPTGIIESAECVYSDNPSAAHSEGTTAITITATPASGMADTQDYSIVIEGTAEALPDGWESGDIGVLGGEQGTVAGTVDYDDNGVAGATIEDIWTLTSGAPNIPTVGAETTDSFRYACTTLSGDGYIEAELSALSGYTFAQAGVMVRKDLSASSPHIFPHELSSSGSNQRKYRSTAAGATTNETTNRIDQHWLRVVRVGDTFTGYTSDTGGAADWDLAVASQVIDMDTVAYYCLALTNIQVTTVATASFTNITVTATTPDDETDSGGLRSHYQGFGATSLGGAGDATKVLCVVNSRLGTSGAPSSTSSDAHTATSGSFLHYHGTFRQCVTGIDSSYVVFDVGGYVEIGTGPISVTSAYLTLAGQTAPAPPVIRNGTIWMDAPEQVYQHIHIRGGDACQGTDALLMRGANTPVFNVVLDHIGVGWCAHGALSISALPNPSGSGTNTIKVQDLLLVDSIVGDNFAGATPSAPFSICFTVTGDTASNVTTSIVRNLFVNCANRGPWVAAGQRADVVNNVNYNARCGAGSDGTLGFAQVIGVPVFTDELIEMAYIGNVNLTGPESVSCDGTVGVQMDAGQVAAGGARVHPWDNSGPGITNNGTDAGQAAGFHYPVTAINVANSGNTICDRACFTAGFSWFHAFNYDILTNSGTTVKDSVMAEAGPWPTARDAIAQRMVNHVTNGTGENDNVPNVSSLGGWPVIADTTGTYIIPANPYSAGTCGTKSSGVARTNLECDLETKARAIEARW